MRNGGREESTTVGKQAERDCRIDLISAPANFHEDRCLIRELLLRHEVSEQNVINKNHSNRPRIHRVARSLALSIAAGQHCRSSNSTDDTIELWRF